MYDTGQLLFGELDPNKKNAEWMNACITAIRRDWTPFVDRFRIRENKKYLFAQQSVDQVKNSFKDKVYLASVEFKSLGFMEALRNASIEEILKTPPTIGVKAEDPTAISEKEKQIRILATKKIVEGDISSTNAQIGLPPFRLDPKKMSSNLGEFQKMGLDDSDPEDISFFSESFHRLWFELAAQSVVNNVMKVNKFDKKIISKIVNDLIAIRGYTLQSYVDQITGEIKQKYLYPETVHGLWGTEGDGSNDSARGWEDTVSVMEWLRMAGDDFDFETQWKELLGAMNHYPNGQKFTGFRRSGRVYSISGDPQERERMGVVGDQFTDIDFGYAYRYKVYVGYAEYITPEATSTYLYSNVDKDYFESVPYSYELKDKKESKEYSKKSRYQQQWYKSFFLYTGVTTQCIYNWGKVYYQNLEGVNDEYASGSMICYREEGDSIMDISRPLIDLGNFAFYKMLFCVHKAKPEEDVVVFEELLEVTKALKREYPQTNGASGAPTLQNIFEQTVQYQQENSVRVRAFPRIDGKAIGQLPSLEGKRNGLDPVAVAMQSVLQWVRGEIFAQTGFNPMRTGANPQSRESFNTEQQTLNSSLNSTGYVYRMVQYGKEALATRALYTAQDIIKFKESVPYKWLKTLIGDASIEQLEALDGIAAHRLGIYCYDYSFAVDKQRVTQAADIALTQKTITLDQWFAVTHTEDFKKAMLLLTYFQRKTEKRLRQQEVQNMQMQDQMSQAAFERQLQLIDRKGQYDVQVSQNQKEAAIYSSQIQADSRIQTKQLQIDGEQPKQQAKTDSQKELLREESNIANQQPFEATPSSTAA